MDELVARFRKNSGEEIQVRAKEFYGRRFVDIRIWAGGRGSETVPTRKGVSVPVEVFSQLVGALDEAQAVLDQ